MYFRFVGLILVPAMIYLGAFYIHFAVAHKSNYMDETQQPIWRVSNILSSKAIL